VFFTDVGCGARAFLIKVKESAQKENNFLKFFSQVKLSYARIS
jgi:hypothetical protein